MALIQIITNFLRKKQNFGSIFKANKIRVLNFNPVIFFSLIIFFSIAFFTISNLIKQKSIENQNNLEDVKNSEEFLDFKNFIISRINSPYSEVKYLIKNNDTIEKILKKYEIRNEDIKEISTQLKRKKLSNIYSGRELTLIFFTTKSVIE